MKSYDSGKGKGIHTVVVTIQQWEYVGHITYAVDGNCKGKDLLDFDFSDLCKIADIITNNDCDITLHGDGVITATLKAPNGTELFSRHNAHFFNNMIVSIEITDFKYGVKDNG